MTTPPPVLGLVRGDPFPDRMALGLEPHRARALRLADFDRLGLRHGLRPYAVLPLPVVQPIAAEVWADPAAVQRLYAEAQARGAAWVRQTFLAEPPPRPILTAAHIRVYELLAEPVWVAPQGRAYRYRPVDVLLERAPGRSREALWAEHAARCGPEAAWVLVELFDRPVWLDAAAFPMTWRGTA